MEWKIFFVDAIVKYHGGKIEGLGDSVLAKGIGIVKLSLLNEKFMFTILFCITYYVLMTLL